MPAKAGKQPQCLQKQATAMPGEMQEQSSSLHTSRKLWAEVAISTQLSFSHLVKTHHFGCMV